MSDWSRAAREYLNGYLQQVTALALERGDEAQEIVEQLRDHVERELEQQGTALITVEHLRSILAELGTPEEVIGVDRATLAARLAPPVSRPAPAVPPVAKRPGEATPPQRIVIERRPSFIAKGCFFAALGLVLLLIVIPVSCIVFSIALPAASRSREAARRAACQGNLKQVGMILRQYLDKHGTYPPLSMTRGELMFDVNAFDPPLQDLESILQCPSRIRVESSASSQVRDSLLNPENGGQRLFAGVAVAGSLDNSYLYIPHRLASAADATEFRSGYEDAIKSGRAVEAALPLLKPEGFPEEGLPPAELPIMIERPRSHVPDGCNVLYLDGHVEFIKMGSKFPVIPDFFVQLNPVDTVDGDPEFTAKPGETSGWAPVVQ